MIDLTKVKKNKVSTDPTSYSLWLVGPPKIGKSTFIQELYGERILFIATEKRFGALDGARNQYISNWGEFNEVMDELDRPEVKEMFDSIAIDTIDNLVHYCETYAAEQFHESELGEGKAPFGKDYLKAKNEWFDGLKRIESSGYNYCFISHMKEVTTEIPVEGLSKEDKAEIKDSVTNVDKQKAVVEYTKKVQNLPDKYLQTVSNMVDNIVFADNVRGKNGESKRALYLRGGMLYGAGVTLQNVPPVVEFTVPALQQAFKKALSTYKNTTSKKKTHADIKDTTYNYDELVNEASELAKDFKKHNKMNVLHEVVSKTLGNDVQVKDLGTNQVQDLALVVKNIKVEHSKLVTE